MGYSGRSQEGYVETTHQIHFGNASRMDAVPDDAVDLAVTSPPYPMIEMWDEQFGQLCPQALDALKRENGFEAFALMHRMLDPVWTELFRVLKPGGIACINIGDATRTIGDRFALYPNHARILSGLTEAGFSPLPLILWRKQTNAPNKFMGSGMLPPGAYVTLEHEYILIVRKGGKMPFTGDEAKDNRRESAYFWEERNIWFSDVWTDLKGTGQVLNADGLRKRSAAYPFELPYRLIHMFSVRGAIVLDPFLGTGTTTLAAMASGRNSIGYELEAQFAPAISSQAMSLPREAEVHLSERLARHLEFCRVRAGTHGPLKYRNSHYGFPVMTRQEKELLFPRLRSVRQGEGMLFTAHYDFKFRQAVENAQMNLALG